MREKETGGKRESERSRGGKRENERPRRGKRETERSEEGETKREREIKRRGRETEGEKRDFAVAPLCQARVYSVAPLCPFRMQLQPIWIWVSFENPKFLLLVL